MSSNGINWQNLNPLRMFTGSQRFTGVEFTRTSISTVIALLGFVALQIAGAALGGQTSAVIPALGTIALTPTLGLLALIAAGVAFIAALQLGWNNIPDVPTPSSRPDSSSVSVTVNSSEPATTLEPDASNRSGIDNG